MGDYLGYAFGDVSCIGRMPKPSGLGDLPVIYITEEKTKRKAFDDAPVCVYRGIDDMILNEILNRHGCQPHSSQ